jgi:predicted outer membrane repeat protein
MRAELWPVFIATLAGAAALKCAPLRQALTVTSAATAAEFTKAVKCSDGVFDVSWQGEVEPPTTIVIGIGTTLRIIGSSSSISTKSAGASINGQSKLQLFTVSKKGVLELSDLTLSGGRLMASSSAQGGAAVFVDEGGTLSASRVTFTGHDSSSDSSSLSGGAIFAAKGAQLALEQCIFTNNTSGASKGGAVYQQSGVAVVQNCTFTANSGSDGGALYSAAGTVNITDSYFFSNAAYATAAADAGTAVPPPPGGLPQPPDASQSPAGTTVAPPGTTVTPPGTTVSPPGTTVSPPGTSVPPPSGGSAAGSPVAPPASDSGYGDALPQGPKGGAVFVLSGTTTVQGSSFYNNSADFGAALCSNGATAVSDSSFRSNAAAAFGGAVFYGKGALAVLSSEFADNSAGNDGGALFQAKGTAALLYSLFEGNRAVSAGGAVAVQAVAVAAENNTYRHNSAGELGGALFIAVCTEEVTTGIACDGTAAVCKHAHSVFLNNTADQGGSVYQRGGTLALSDSVFSSNTALRSAGGAIWSSQESSLTVTAAEFSMNAAAVDGGAISMEGNSSISDTHFSNNTATQHGGAVIVKSAGAVTFTTCVFSGNSAVYGGSLQAAAVPADTTVPIDTTVRPLTVSGCTFSENKGIYGGAAHVIRSAVTVSDSTFKHNVASNLGGAICVEGSGSIDVSSTTFDANTASTGGAVNCQQQATASISTSVFTANTGVDGGAISVQCKATISSTLFNSNVARATGGAISYISIQLSGIASTIDGCTMHGNSAVEGGAIAVQQNVTLTISSSTITNNSAQLSAGGISQQYGYAMLPVLQQGTIVQNNTAGCCNAAGYGINATTINNSAGNTTNSCADIDSGTDRQCCVIGEYSNGTACIRCPDGYACTTLGLTVPTLPVMPGRWRENITQLEARQCWNANACKGGVAKLNISTSTSTSRALASAAATAAATALSDSYCAEGYKGPCK